MKKKTVRGKIAPKSVREASIAYSTVPAPDKKMLVEMFESYNRWNIEKEKIRIEKEGSRTPTQAFENYLGLWEFGQKFGGMDKYSRPQKIESMLRYYENIKKFEAWRRARANSEKS